jgi:hypothetical protein
MSTPEARRALEGAAPPDRIGFGSAVPTCAAITTVPEVPVEGTDQAAVALSEPCKGERESRGVLRRWEFLPTPTVREGADEPAWAMPPGSYGRHS